ncbi:MAG: homocysteine S-methyltransferase family protein [Candidatus Hodarchaeales archaeon]|jgi:5-methyltetrahydrofolate--homocysteine methyltransferase
MLFTKWLNDPEKIILFDGAMGTQIIKRGLKVGVLPDLLNLEDPEMIKEILRSYYEAGADMVQTCTFSSNNINLEKYQLSERLVDINRSALSNIIAVKGDKRLVVGDIGPSGEFRPPVGNATGDKWFDSFLPQVRVLEQGIDLWHIETMSDLMEIEAGIDVIQTISNKPIIASLTYRSTRTRGFNTIMGDSLEKCVRTLENKNVSVIGANCTLGSNEIIALAKDMIEITDFPVSIKPNAGQPRLEGGMTTYDQTSEEFVKDIEEIIDLGVKIVGGCCGTTPLHIQKIRELIDSR